MTCVWLTLLTSFFPFFAILKRKQLRITLFSLLLEPFLEPQKRIRLRVKNACFGHIGSKAFCWGRDLKRCGFASSKDGVRRTCGGRFAGKSVDGANRA